MGNIVNYYATGSTARGFYSLLDSNLMGLKKLFLLKGGPGTGKSTLMKEIGQWWSNKGYDIEYLHCPNDTNSIDGVINANLKIVILADGAPYLITPIAPGAIDEYINLGTAWDSKKLEEKVEDILLLNYKKNNSYREAYDNLYNALKVHDEWEKIYVQSMSTKRADSYAEEIVDMLLKNGKLEKQSIVKDRFMGATTPDGPKDFVEDLTSKLSKRYFIKGRPGTGKSTILRKVAQAARERGYDVEIYHCSFDPNSLDMVILRELDVCIFDSTSPHEYFPSRESDEILDVYKEFIIPGTDEKYEIELKDIVTRYKEFIKKAVTSIKEAYDINNEMEEIYKAAMDFKKVDKIREDLKKKLTKYE